MLEEDREAMLDGIVTTATLPTSKDDLYGRRTYKPKSHKEKNKKKCK